MIIGYDSIPLRDEIELELSIKADYQGGLAMLFLTEPTLQYKESFLEGLREFQQEGLLTEYDVRSLSRDFSRFLRHVQNEKDRSKIPPHHVPATRYWLIDGNEHDGIYIGNLFLRHELNPFLFKVAGHIGYQIRPSMRHRGYGKKILQLGLEKAREIGLPRALVTCDETNIGSKKVIEYNGGQFDNAVDIEGSTIKKLRYWINLTA